MTTKQLIALQSLSMDLLRTALGRHQGDQATATTFTKESKKRIEEIGDFDYRDRILSALDSDHERSAEDLLMYSTLVKNRALS